MLKKFVIISILLLVVGCVAESKTIGDNSTSTDTDTDTDTEG